jgi:hypothetical protein
MRAIDPASGVLFFRLQLLATGRTKKSKFHWLRMALCFKEIKKLMAQFAKRSPKNHRLKQKTGWIQCRVFRSI